MSLPNATTVRIEAGYGTSLLIQSCTNCYCSLTAAEKKRMDGALRFLLLISCVWNQMTCIRTRSGAVKSSSSFACAGLLMSHRNNLPGDLFQDKQFKAYVCPQCTSEIFLFPLGHAHLKAFFDSFKPIRALFCLPRIHSSYILVVKFSLKSIPPPSSSRNLFS